MKNIVLAAFLTAISVTGANAATSPQPNQSRYAQLLALFDQGVAPTETELTGEWSGRCYVQKAPNVAWGSVLVAKAMPNSDLNGPLFPPKTFFNVFIATDANPVAFDYYPNGIDDVSWNPVRGYINNSAGRDLTALDVLNTIASKSAVSNAEFLVRKSQNYFVSKIIRPVSDKNKADEVLATCYSFNKVHE
jgi:hypothetical protein